MAVATPETANLFGGPATNIKIGGTSIGGSMGPVTVRWEKTDYEFQLNQGMGMHFRKPATRRMYVGFTISESTITLLRIALDQASGNLVTSTLSITETANGSTPLIFEAPGPNSTFREYSFPGAVVQGITETYDRSPHNIPVEFEIMEQLGATLATNYWGTVREKTVAW